MERDSDDEITVKKTSDTWFDAVSGVVKQKFIYPWSAYIAFSVDAEQFGSSLPTRTYRLRGRIISVPDNYDPETRTYTGFWSGDFKQAWTDNPAWIFLDMFTNDRYGSGRPIEEIDIATLYEIAQYCDEMVPDGFGGEEPRYTINVVLNTAQDAYALYNSILSAFRGMFFWANGQISFSQDSPRAVDALVTPANVETGFFSYTSSKERTRPNTIYVQYNNPNNNDEPDFEIVEYNEDIIARGTKISRVVAWGCRSQGQAHRHGEWLLYTLHYDTSLISYTAGVDHDGVLPGHIIAVADPMKSSQKRAGGRIVSASGVTVVLDRPLNLPSGSYKIMLTDENRNVVYYNLQTFASGATTVSTTATIAETIMPNSVWVVYDLEAGEILYRVTSVSEKRGRRQVAALQYNPSKFPFIERDLPLETPATNAFVGGNLKAPQNVNYTPVTVELPGAANRIDLLVSWTYPENENRIADFELQYAEDSANPVFVRKYTGRDVSFTIENISTSTNLKAIRVRSRGEGEKVSPWVTVSNIQLYSRTTSPLAPSGLTCVSESYGKGIVIAWELDEPKDFKYVEVFRATSNDFNAAVNVGNTRTTQWRDTNLVENQIYYYWVRTVVYTDNPAAENSGFAGPQSATALSPPVSDILDGSVTSAKIADAAITAAKIMDEAVTNLKLADEAVSTAKIEVAAVTAALLASSAVISSKIADAAVTGAKLASQAVDATKLATSIEAVKVVTSIPTSRVSAYITYNSESYRWDGTAYVKTFDADEITGQMVSSQLADAAVTAAKLANAAVTATKFASSIEPVSVVSSLPGSKTTAYVTFGGEKLPLEWYGLRKDIRSQRGYGPAY